MKQIAKVGLCATALMLACGGEKKADVAAVDHSNRPAWVDKGGSAFSGDKAKAFYGVGIASGIKSVSLARSTADNHARVEIARSMRSYVTALYKSYQRATSSSADANASAEEQDVQDTMKNYTEAELSGVDVVDRFTDSDGTVYSLAKLDFEKFRDGLDQMKQLNAKVRDFVRQNAETAFDELSAEEAKHHQ
jgi:hypothetical protein